MTTSAEFLQKYVALGGDLPLEIANAGRNDFARWLEEWGLDKGVEVGTFSGDYASILLEANPRLHLSCVDPWEAYEAYVERELPVPVAAAYELAAKSLARFGDRCALVRKQSVDAAKDFVDGSLDFVYIDGNHDYFYVSQDIEAWSAKVRRGGIVSGHDFRRKLGNPHFGVMRAVIDFARRHKIDPWFVIGSKAITPGTTRDQFRSWMWVNP